MGTDTFSLLEAIGALVTTLSGYDYDFISGKICSSLF